MGDKSPKDREKKKKQHDKQVSDLNRTKQEKAQKKADNVESPVQDQPRKAG
ncbi:hypothetical protein [Oligoflexus tunisiensis]|uniref:hypothetical protein n=1 Tax=Oligoflexus tunisiensis TaxID=708132 RepID=UPI00159F30D8|nr:hypothetical protein [Oligoflexus tunisiensis]